MATLVDIQAKFEAFLKQLAEFDCNLLESCEAAINKAENEEDKKALMEYKEGYQARIKDLFAILKKHNVEPVCRH